MYKSLETVRDYFKETGNVLESKDLAQRHDKAYRGPNWHNKFEAIHGSAHMRLRFDAVVSDYYDFEMQLESVFNDVQRDLEDLVENGDVNNYQDSLLLAFDGAKKRGKEVGNVEINEAILYRDPKPEKKVHEYTLYVLGRVDFQ